MTKKAWVKEVNRKMEELQQYLDGPFVAMHEYEPDDVEFANRLEGLHGVVSALYKATFLKGESEMERKCHCGQKQAACGKKRITLELHNIMTIEPCAICGKRCEPDEFDFLMDNSLVCPDCAKDQAPDLYLIWRDATHWHEKDLPKVFNDGVISGKTTAGQMILDAMSETELERVKRVCRVDLGAMPCREGLPF